MSPGLLKRLMIFVFFVGVRSLRDVMKKNGDLVYDLLVFACAVILLIKYMLQLPVLG